MTQEAEPGNCEALSSKYSTTKTTTTKITVLLKFGFLFFHFF